ncbi:D-inositol-3-phosphate glycosyltransferase [Methylobacterium mesophilicum]|uniref:glycosyltransferase n=1 Tax=Methylobacterium mesophilicum TaxID=39956 RepID=UPI001EE1AD7E|nr:glycosyltransferase [Methylobacterium mesophilicum]GJE22617.1 D-inositol-3-phosphate glycosyltransferase [Methylobacterium mesophilicum]
MRILIDLQAAQTEASGRRGVGRYSVALARKMAVIAGSTEIWLALNGRYAAGADQLRAEFEDLVPPERIRLFNVPAHSSHVPDGNAWRRRTGELLRESFFADLKPDFVLVGSLFEGLLEDAVTSVNRLPHPFPTGVTLYDLIPLLNPDAYLDRKFVRNWYFEKLASLKRADVLFAISESSRREALDHLSLAPSSVVNISCAVDEVFKKREFTRVEEASLKRKYGVRRQFVMYTGGIDFRKNIEGLLEAWALIAQRFRPSHQLAIVCSIQSQDRARLEALASELGLQGDDVIFTGYVPEDDLVSLYNLCDVFVFPSLHEGFGLPALEAMACGAPTIGADNSSIVEVIGFRDAMFDARSPSSIARKIAEVLDDQGFREALKANAARQAQAFSWQTTAERTLTAIRHQVAERASGRPQICKPLTRKPTLAFVSPMPPLETGIADYSAELLPELDRFYDIEIVTDQAELSDSFAEANYRQTTIEDFRKNPNRFDRILYQFGNSDFHTHMFDLVRQHPGVVVLHDFYLSGVQAWREHHHREQRHFTRSLVRSHGYRALIDHLEGEPDDAIWRYPVNHDVLEAAMGVIVHSAFNDQGVRASGLEPDAVACIPHLRAVAHPNRAAARERLGIADGERLLCTFGSIGKHKNSLRLLEAFAEFSRENLAKTKLVFVGQGASGSYGAGFDRALALSCLAEKVEVTGYVDKLTYQTYLAAADTAIQLRAFTRGETSGAVLDCLAHGIPTIVNAHGPMAEIGEDAVVKLSEDPSVSEITGALRALLTQEVERKRLSRGAITLIRDTHSPRRVGELYWQAIETFSSAGTVARCHQMMSMAVQDRNFAQATAADIANVSKCIDLNLPLRRAGALYIDVSELVVRDWHSGIQRVVKGILPELLQNPPLGLRVEPVYAHCDANGAVYRSARRFTSRFLGLADDQWEDEVIEPVNGDIFIGLDLAPILVPKMFDEGVYMTWRARGVRIHFVVYDLIPVLRPEFFAPGAADDFSRWLKAIAQVSDSIACISRAVSNEFKNYLLASSAEYREGLKIDWFHLGNEVRDPDVASMDSHVSTPTRPDLAGKSYVLMVGTLEPRKGHMQIIDAFEALWNQGSNICLVMVGRQGWLVDELVAKIDAHPFLGKCLFWYSDADDVALESFYNQSAGLIAASYAEGYGLPLIEAAKRGVPIFARDIAVFREVAGVHAAYFDESGSTLVEDLRVWLEELSANNAPSPVGISILTWAQSSEQLLKTVFGCRLDNSHTTMNEASAYRAES